MAIVTASAANYLSRSSPSISATGLSVAMWVITTDNTTNWQMAFDLGDGGTNFGTQLHFVAAFPDASGWYEEGATACSVAGKPTNNVWYFVAATRTGDAGTNVFYRRALTDATMSSDTQTAATPGYTISSMQLTHSAKASGNLLGRIAAVKIWSGTVLTADEIWQESQYYVPVMRDSRLWLWSPFVDVDEVNFRDYSGNGRDWTETGAVTIGDGPPIAWRPTRQRTFSYTSTVVGQPASRRGQFVEGMRFNRPSIGMSNK